MHEHIRNKYGVGNADPSRVLEYKKREMEPALNFSLNSLNYSSTRNFSQ